ncbi:N-acetyltransferase [Butyrivibrio sp. INlla16]|uniref:GNAT family N-acetyltransferase n=1 Tax=Butyrivibrio sp. INlla16 TaxID=1520807 RepID=UPI0008885AD6|nr:GNAT family N-acetyltransferase [Butyrivibrio sp. INlla16]SDB64469.1 Acetyltransferase (GNAT) family protein [Butyrivibrio sp. INlla16]
MTIRQLGYDEYNGKRYKAEVRSNKYLSIEPADDGFSVEWIEADNEIVEPLEDDMLSEWLDNPVAYGAFEGDVLIGFVEGFLEAWNNRYRISNICVFDVGLRSQGVGTALLETILKVAVDSGARMAVLETQSYNSKAILFYKKNGFELIGFDRYAYSNEGPEEHNMRIEMGKRL